MRSLFASKNDVSVRLKLFDTLIYEKSENRTQAFEMRCYRRVLNISYNDHVTNEEVRRKIQEAI